MAADEPTTAGAPEPPATRLCLRCATPLAEPETVKVVRERQVHAARPPQQEDLRLALFVCPSCGCAELVAPVPANAAQESSGGESASRAPDTTARLSQTYSSLFGVFRRRK